jgi:hypothetical protein
MTRAFRLIWTGLALLAGLAPLAEAEDRETALLASSPFADLHRGDRIRVRLRSDDSFRARFAAASQDTLWYAVDKRPLDERRLPFASIEGLDRRDGSRSHLLVGALLGLVAGAGIGALISTSEEAGTTQWVATLIYGVAGAGGGLVVGSVVGVCIRSDRWAPVYDSP